MFREYAVGAKKDDNHLFQKNGFPDTDWQAKLILILEFGIVECETKTSIENQLVKDIEEQYYCFGTGLQFTPFVLKTLMEMGRVDLVYKLLRNEHLGKKLVQLYISIPAGKLDAFIRLCAVLPRRKCYIQ